MGNFCNEADFTLYLLICKFMTFVKRMNIRDCIYYIHIYIYIYIYIYISGRTMKCA